MGLDTYALWKPDTETPPRKDVLTDLTIEGMYRSTDMLA